MARYNSMDEWLDSQGFYRKHTGKDGSCLFRAVSEQVFHTQAMHIEVRKACIRHMEEKREKFAEFIEGSYDDYLNKLRNPKEGAGQVEMSAMAVLYYRDFLVFQEVGKGASKVTDYGFQEKILLCWSPANQFDSVYLKRYISNAAFCQSMVYDILYKKVFRLGDEVDLAIEKMLHDKAYAKLRKDSTASIESTGATQDFGMEQDEESNGQWIDKTGGSEIRRALAQGFPPFPYKVAKALDGEIYRNVEFDVWNEEKKDETVFEPGVKCLVRLNKSESEAYHAHIQEVSPNKGPVTVYIVELGKKQTVTFESLEPLPSYNKAGWQTFGKNYKALSPYYHKPSINGTIAGIDKYKIKKKVFKKGKFKEYQFALPLGRGQGLPPFQPQYDAPVLQMGRGRNGFHGITRNSSHIKWLAPLSQNQRYQPKNNGGSRFFVPNIEINANETHKFYENKVSYNGSNGVSNQDMLSPSHLQTSTSSATTSVTWVKSLGSVAPTPVYSSASVTPTPQFKHDITPSTDSCQKDESEVASITSSMGAVKVPNSLSGVTIGSNNPQGVPAPSYFSTGSYTTTLPSTPPNGPQGVNSQGPSPSYITSPQPVTLFPYYYSGIYVPFDPSAQPVNYSVNRSQDPNGSDLPLQDLATLRFFFNLGCDYFRMAAVIPVPSATQYAMLNFGNQMGYSSVNGYLTPLSSSDGCEGLEESSPASVPGLSPSEGTTETDSSPPHSDELYEPTYLCGSAPVSFIPAAVYHPLDYCTPVPVGEFKSGLVLNDQGVLSLNSSMCVPPAISFSQPVVRHRSDSCSSSFSQSSNQDVNSGHNHRKFTSCNNNYGSTLCEGRSSMNGNGVKLSSGMSTPCHPPPPSSLQMQHLSPQKQPCSPYRNPPILQIGVPPTPASFSVVQTGSPLFTNSAPSIGVFTSNSPGTPAVFTATPAATYYGSPPPTVIYPAVHPQPVPFITSSAH